MQGKLQARESLAEGPYSLAFSMIGAAYLVFFVTNAIVSGVAFPLYLSVNMTVSGGNP